MKKITNGKCPTYGDTLERRENMFYWRGRYFHGLVCVRHNSLYDDPSDSFAEHVGINFDNAPA